MLDASFDHSGILYFVAFLAVLLILAVLTSNKPLPWRDRELLATLNSGRLAPALDDVRRLEAALGGTNRRTQELLASCTLDYNSKFGDAIYRIQRGVRAGTDGDTPLFKGATGPGPTR
jgi:hypothetical protein